MYRTRVKSSERQMLIFGFYGWGNIGDDAMLFALLQHLCALYPKTEYAVISRSPTILPKCAEGKVIFVKPTIGAFLKAVRKSSVFIIGGGTHLHDYGRRTLIIRMLLRLLAIVAIAKLHNNKVYLIGNGVGPLSTKWGELLTSMICRLSDRITVRDKTSYQILETLGTTSRASLSFDVSAILASPQESATSFVNNGTNEILGICVTPVFEQYYSDKVKDLITIGEIARVVNKQLAAMPKLQVCLFVFKTGAKYNDVPLTQLLKQQLTPSERISIIPYNPDPRETLSQVAQCSAFVGTKYHSCLFAYLKNVPLLILDYHPKCRALANEIGLPQNAILSLDEVSNGQFEQRLENLLVSPDEFRASLPVSRARDKAIEGIKV